MSAVAAAVVPSDDALPPPLVCTGLVVSLEQRRVLSDVSLELPAGAVLGLLGRNGAGKTTLIRALLGLQPSHAGAVQLFGRPVAALDDAMRQRIGYVGQQTDGFGWLRVGDLLAVVGACYPRWDKRWVDAMLAQWALDPKAQIGRLSPGQRQRLALIRAMAYSPELLVLDEPASALDPVARRELLREIVQRAGVQGTTVLFSTHIVSDLERVASDVALLHAGQVAFCSPLDQLKDDLLRLHVPAAHAALAQARQPGELARTALADGGLRLLLRREAGRWPALAEAPGVLRDVPGLEDLFVEVAA